LHVDRGRNQKNLTADFQLEPKKTVLIDLENAIVGVLPEDSYVVVPDSDESSTNSTPRVFVSRSAAPLPVSPTGFDVGTAALQPGVEGNRMM
jgi:hypothetical protein